MSLNHPTEALVYTNQSLPVATSYTPIKQRNYNRNRALEERFIFGKEKYNEEHITNIKKQRYWNSSEELYLVELWRRYRDEVTKFNVPLPVYRKMMIDMRYRDMSVTTRDCQRRINTLHSRYRHELKCIETTGCKSDWKLFSLIHCILQPKIKDYDPWHENKIIKKLLDKLPQPLEEKPAPLAPVPIIHSRTRYSDIPARITNTVAKSPGTKFQQQKGIYKDNIHNSRREPLPILFSSSTFGQFEKPSILPFRNITMQKIEQLRRDNIRLAAQRDNELKSLLMEEENFRSFETSMRLWSEQKELELNRVTLLTQQSVSNKENGGNMAQQLQDILETK